MIRSIDSALVVAADDSNKLRDVGRRVQQLLPAGGHFNRSYTAREIYETFGADSLYPGESNLFAFWRTYAEAEAKRGNPPPYSPRAVMLLDALEQKYLKPWGATTSPFLTLGRRSLESSLPGPGGCSVRG